MGSAAVSRSGFGLLRQLANSDAIKNAIVDQDGLELINTAVAAHAGSSGAQTPRSQLLSMVQAMSSLLFALMCSVGNIDNSSFLDRSSNWAEDVERCASQHFALRSNP